MSAMSLFAFSAGPLVGVPVALFIGGLISAFSIYFIVKNRKRYKLIEGTPLVKTEQLQPGLAQVHGQALALGPMIKSPLTNTQCVYFHFILEEERTRMSSTGGSRGAKVESYWQPIIDDRQAAPCAVGDETGWAEVNLKDAETVLKVGACRNSGFIQSAPPDVKKRLEKQYNHSTKGWVFEKKTRYTETVIKEGDELFVLGEAVPRQRGQRLRFVKGQQPLLISDKDSSALAKHYKFYFVASCIGAAVAILGTLCCMGMFTILSFTMS